MTKESIKDYISHLSEAKRTSFLLELNTIKDSSSGRNPHQLSRRQLLDDKQGVCPHCSYGKYVHFGRDGSQRYRFWGVSTKYLQQHLNWFRLTDLIKNSKD